MSSIVGSLPNSDLPKGVIGQVKAADAGVRQQALADHEARPRVDGVRSQAQGLQGTTASDKASIIIYIRWNWG